MNKKKEKSNALQGELFSSHNYKFLVIGLIFIFCGFALMLGPDANTIEGVYNKNNWNQDIFSWRRIRLAPLLIVIGFAIEVYAILSESDK